MRLKKKKKISQCICVYLRLCCGEFLPYHPRWTGGMAADELRRASVTDHDCTCSPGGARSVGLGVHVCVSFSF